jgi:hypothetical protein
VHDDVRYAQEGVVVAALGEDSEDSDIVRVHGKENDGLEVLDKALTALSTAREALAKALGR